MARPTNRQVRQREALALNENQTLRALLDEYAADIRDRWEASTDPAERERLWSEIRAVRGLSERIYAAAHASRIEGPGKQE